MQKSSSTMSASEMFGIFIISNEPIVIPILYDSSYYELIKASN
jgi:hypothetical protein